MQFVTVIVLSIFYIGTGKPVSDDSPEYIKKVTITHFGNSQDFKDVDVPSAEISDGSHPYSFTLNNNGSGNYKFM